MCIRDRLAAGRDAYAVGAAELEGGKADYAEGLASYEAGKAEYDERKADAEAQLADAEAQLDAAQEEIDALEAPEIMVLDRTKNIGAESFRSDAARIDRIAMVFPFIFFLVAALVSLTTMTRMVEEERVLIGTYKAVSYTHLNGRVFRAGGCVRIRHAARFVVRSFIGIGGVQDGRFALPRRRRIGAVPHRRIRARPCDFRHVRP